MKIVNIDTARLNRKPVDETENSSLRPGAGSNADQPVGSDCQDAVSSRNGGELSEAVVEALDIRAPRYTSYPTADRFVEAFGLDEFAQHLALREFNHGVPLSVYLHIPFCSTLCFYCACNKTIIQNYQKARPYVTRLIEEMNLVDAHLGGERKLSQMHWGGGTPTYLQVEEIRQLVGALRDRFSFSTAGEYSDDVLRRAMIMAIMCQGEIDKASVEIAYLIEFDSYFESELKSLEPMVYLGFVDLGANRIVVTNTGRRKALRLIAGTFDRYLVNQSSRGRFSRVL